MAKAKNDYFKYIEEQAACSCEASKLLQDVIKNLSDESLKKQISKMNEVRRRANKMKLDTSAKLSMEFITPIEKEDILKLVQINLKITGTIAEVVLELYMYNIKTAPRGTAELAKLVDDCVVILGEVTAKLRDFKKIETIRPYLDKVSKIAREVGAVYAEGIHLLFMTETTPRSLIGCKEIFDSLKECCDICSHTFDVVEQVIVKNT